MNKVKRHNDWCSHDELDGVKLKNGEKLRLQWPNGQMTEQSIIVEKYNEEHRDHGHSSSYAQERAVVAVTGFGGISQRVSIIGLLAERI